MGDAGATTVEVSTELALLTTTAAIDGFDGNDTLDGGNDTSKKVDLSVVKDLGVKFILENSFKRYFEVFTSRSLLRCPRSRLRSTTTLWWCSSSNS